MKTDMPHLLPHPANLRMIEGRFTVKPPIEILTSAAAISVLPDTINNAFPENWLEGIEIQEIAPEGWFACVGQKSIPETTELPADEEAYHLTITEETIKLTAADVDGLRQGLRTLGQILNHYGEIPALEITDRPALRWRGIMIDMVRLKERDEVYFRLLDEMAAWKMNVLFLHFTDNQGCTIELKSRPELISAHAMPQDILKKLIQYGNSLGIRIIPEVEAWGHARWITDHHPELQEPESNSMCLGQEGIYDILQDVLQEVASLFPDPILHIGCDEASFGQDDACKKIFEQIGEDALIADHINRVNQMVRNLGKTSMIWADVVANRDGVLKLLDKDIIAEDWSYYTEVTPDNIRKLKSGGFTTWAAPALVMGSWRIMPANYNLENVQKFAHIAAEEKAEGIATTIWLPQRWIPGSIGPGIAWAAQQSWCPDNHSRPDTMAAFLYNRFGLSPTPERVERMVRTGNVGQRNPSQAFWGTMEALLAHDTPEGCEDDSRYEASVRGLTYGLSQDLPEVKKNREQFEGLVLAATLAEHLADRRAIAAEVVSRMQQALSDLEDEQPIKASEHLKGAVLSIRHIEENRAGIFTLMQENWDRDRYEDDPFRTGEGNTNSLYWWFGSPESYGFSLELADHLEALAESPDPNVLRGLLGIEVTSDAQNQGNEGDPYVEK